MVSFRKLSKGEAIGGWRNPDFKGGRGGMIATDVTKFHKCHLGSRGMLKCVCVQGFKFRDGGGGGTPKFMSTWRGCITQNN